MALNVVEVAYSPDYEQLFFVSLQVPAGTAAQEALVLSGLFEQFPELVASSLDMGVFSTRIQPDYLVQSGDRLVVYRPLRISPMEARQRRAQKR
jgi:putative ubiquitin-RnfH superfamily antitoxin RatB of RatAB toxin-antitoxin module